jgi:hypothetical protein
MGTKEKYKSLDAFNDNLQAEAFKFTNTVMKMTKKTAQN